MRLHLLSWLGAALLISILGTGCNGPCDSLAETICECQPNRTEESACLEQVRAANQRDITTAENEECSRLLDTCTCEALEREDYRACGLSR